MVLSHNFPDIFETISQNPTLSLPVVKENILKIDYKPNDVNETVYSGLQPPLPFSNSELYLANILNWRQLTSETGDCKAVYEVTFNVADSNFKFKGGDTIGVVPHNAESEVDFIIDHLSLTQADVCYNLSINGVKGRIPAHIPEKSTLRHVLTHCVDLRAVIKKLFLLALSTYTKEENERKVLEYFCSKEGSAAYSTHILNKNICLIDLFTVFKSCKPPIEVILANLPRLLPRPYSIVNSGLRDATVIKICFSVMNISDSRRGLTTGWLEDKIKGDFNLEDRMKNLKVTGSTEFKVPIYLRKNISEFNLPDHCSPLILIGAGTGVAPFMGFLEEIEDSNKRDVYLYFGCRNPKLDFIYEKELNSFLTGGVLKKLTTAFSRVDNDGVKYIQDALLKDGKEIAALIKDGASIFVCGDVNTLATQVKEVLVECILEHDSKSQEEAETIILDMQKQKRYFVDAWS